MKYLSLKKLLPITLCLITACSSLSDSEQNKVKLYYNHGTECLANADYPNAIRHLRSAIALDKNHAKAYNNLGMALHFAGKDDMAIEHLQRSIQIDQNSDAKNNLAALLIGKQRYVEARSLLQEVIADLVYTVKYRAYYNLALIARENNDKKAAIDYLNSAIKERSDYCPAHYMLGEIAESMGDLRTAYNKYYDASKGICIKEPQPLISQAKVLIRLNNIELAKSKLEFIIQKFKDSSYAQEAQQLFSRLESRTYRQSSF